MYISAHSVITRDGPGFRPPAGRADGRHSQLVNEMRKLIVFALILCGLGVCHAAAPVCLYQDVLSGPASGGEGGNGIYLSIFGKNFGSARGSSTVTINGTPVAQYLVWGTNNDATGNHDQISVQVASGTTSGNVVVTTLGGSCSNLSFTVRSGNIWYIGSGTDNVTISSPTCSQLENDTVPGDVGNGGKGTYADPWKMTNASSGYTYSTGRTPFTYQWYCANPGDTIVFLNGVSFVYDDGLGEGSSFTLDMASSSPTAVNPYTVMARPGATVQIGSPTGAGANTGIHAYPGITNLIISGLQASGSGPGDNGLGMSIGSGNSPSNPTNARIVNNIVTCPTCNGGAAALAAGWYENGSETSTQSVGVEVLGNWVYNAGCSDSGGVTEKEFHFIYTNGSGQEIGWNKVGGTGATAGCAYNGIQINYYADDEAYGYGNFSVHDNDISFTTGAGINLATVDPRVGPINVYNNIIHHIGVTESSDAAYNPNGIYLPGYGPSLTGTQVVNIYNNTLFDTSVALGSVSYGTSGGSCLNVSNLFQTGITYNLVNNLCAQPSYTFASTNKLYLAESGTGYSELSGSNNLFYSANAGTPTGTPQSSLTSLTISTNPLFVSTTTPGSWTNLELQATSPAIAAGSASLYPALDFAGNTRPNPPAIGALEYGSASSATQMKRR